MIDLPHVTLCALGSNDIPLAARALEISRAHCNFADAILFSHESFPGSFRHAPIARPASMAEYTAFMIKQLGSLISTDFALVTQWDGYVINPTAWRDEFLQYDYIGAVWPWKPDQFKVGNGGFSLRSRKLLAITAEPWFALLPNLGEDELICRVYRPILEERNIRFAPPEVAERFAYERSIPQSPTFGFHGMFNFWREVSDTDLVKMIPLMPRSLFHHHHCVELVLCYYELRRWTPLRALYSAWRAHDSFQEVQSVFTSALPGDALTPCLNACESLIKSA